MDIRAKAKVFYNKQINTLEDVPNWDIDGSSTFQTYSSDSDTFLKPVALFRDPFRGDPNKIVLCEALKADGTSALANFRSLSLEVMQKAKAFEPYFGIEQEYVIMNTTKWPLGFQQDFAPKSQGMYYGAVQYDLCFGREVMEAHLKACLFAGVKIFGTNAEDMPGQWEFQVGICDGNEIGDHLWMARYLLARVATEYKVLINYFPKPISGDWNGSGCHINFSTVQMRSENGYQEILQGVEKLKPFHKQILKAYGYGNEKRLLGTHETSNFKEFTYSIGSRCESVRINNQTFQTKRGYFEDRRPAANIDPYVACAALVDIVCLDGNQFSEGYRLNDIMLKNNEKNLIDSRFV